MPKYWSCSCGTRNERIKQRCTNPDCSRKRPKKRTPPHARTLRDDSYATYEKLNAEIHGSAFGGEWTPDCCGCCGKPPKARRHDRDHDHATGNPRGLACWHCNRELLRHATLDDLRNGVAFLERVENHYGSVAA